MYVEEVRSVKKNGKVYRTFLVRESYREKGRVRHRTLANISRLPANHIFQIRRLMAGGGGNLDSDELALGRSREFGASFVFAELARQLGLDKALYSRPTDWRQNALAMIVGRIVYQGSKLNLTNLHAESCLWELYGHRPGERPDVEKTCYEALDELLKRQKRIQRRLAGERLANGCLILYDITNIWMEGEYARSELVDYGRGKNGKRGYKQVAIGLIADKHGCPVAVEVFRGNTSDQTTVEEQAQRLSREYGVKEIVFAGDRGMLTPKRIDEVNAEGFKTLTALTHPQIMALLEQRVIEMDLFDERHIAEILDPDRPGVRYMLCMNRETRMRERATRQSLMDATDAAIKRIAKVKRKRRAQDVAAQIGKTLGKYKVGKFYQWHVSDEGRVQWHVDAERVEREKALDGCYVIRSDVARDMMNPTECVQGYKSLQQVEKAFRNLKTVALEIRPVFHKTDERIRAHVFVCMLAYYLLWHAARRLAPLFATDGKGKNRRWSMQGVIESLKSIVKTECFAAGMHICDRISKPDQEQSNILDALDIVLPRSQ